MSDETRSPPTGWYPDPKGDRQWRIWNGREWTPRTRSYGPEAISAERTMIASRAQGTLAKSGVLAYWSGLGLALDTVLHRSSITPTMSNTVAGVFLIVALFLFSYGSSCYAKATATLSSAPRLSMYVPIVNTFVWVNLAFTRCHYVMPVIRKTSANRSESTSVAVAMQLMIFIAMAAVAATAVPHATPFSYLDRLIPAVGFWLNYRWATLLRDDLAV